MNYRIILVIFLLPMTIHASPVQNPGSRGVDWENVKFKADNFSWAKAIVSRLKQSVKEVEDNFAHPPLGTTGWFHEYFCEDDANRLIFDPQKPNEHVCPHCQKVYSGPPYDDCWRSSAHSQFAGAAESAAIVYRLTGEKRYLDFAKSVLLWYAENFHQFQPHGDHAGKGIVREQSLDEATQLVRLTTAYWDSCEFLSNEEREVIVDQFLIPDAKFIHSQTGSIHNIHSWHNAAVGLAGMAIGDQGLATAAIDGPYGLNQQIEKGVKEDGFWYEGSISYHFYTIASMQPLYLAAKAQGLSIARDDLFFKMHTAPIDFSFPNGEFPANNDGWPGQSILDRASYYETASSFMENEKIDQLLSRIYQNQSRNDVSALLFGKNTIKPASAYQAKSVLFNDSGIAILRNANANAYLKFGPYGGGHDHYDRLNMILFGKGNVLAPDLGTPGYGIALNHTWYRTSAAHNMLVVDGKRQARCGGYLIDYNESMIHAGVKEAYSGVDMQRKLELNQAGITDTVSAISKETHQYDLIYHVRGTLNASNVELQPSNPFEPLNGYNIFAAIQHGDSVVQTELNFSLRDVEGNITFLSSSDKPFELFIATCPDNPADKKMTAIILRRNDISAQFSTQIKIQ